MNGAVLDDGIITEAMMYNPNLPFEIAYRVARRWRGVENFGWPLCARRDATPEALAEWSDDSDMDVTKAGFRMQEKSELLSLNL
jgi:hypothetical protein